MNADLNSITTKFKSAAAKLLRYRIIFFIIAVCAVYAFLSFRIETLSSAEPNPDSLSSAASQTPHIDQATIDKIKQLQDNSVTVQTLFDQARQNPFHE